MNKIRTICVAASLFIHSTAITMIAHDNWVERIMTVKLPDIESELRLQFVDTPDGVPPEQESKDAKLISDKSVTAQDEYEGESESEAEGSRTEEAEEGRQLAKQSQAVVQQPKEPVLKQPEEEPVEEEEEEPEPEPEPEIKDLSEEPAPEKDKPDIVTAKLTTPAMPIEEQITPEIESPQPADDIVSLPEVSEDIFNAKFKGELLFETAYHKMGPYFKDLKREIEFYWLKYLLFKYPNSAPIESEVTISFIVLPDGSVIDIKVVEFIGDEIFKDFCVATINNTAPFPPLPEDVSEDELGEKGGLDIVFTFRFR